MSYLIDVTGTCNLRCPSCPVGNFSPSDFVGGGKTKGFMDFNLFKEIILKIKKDNTSMLPIINSYNRGEPLIHPNIIEMIEFIKQQGFQPKLSSNLNTELDMKAFVKTKPLSLIISMSGYYQETYEKNHRGGKVSLVKSNMYKMRHYMDKLKINFNVRVSYHMYKDNVHNDFIMMSNLCQELGFTLQPGYAFIQPLEKVLSYLTGGTPTVDEKNVIDRLFFTSQERKAIVERYALTDCSLRKDQMSINYDGSVGLCCSTFDHEYTIANSFLEVAHDELQKRKYEHPLCKTCMQNALHKMATITDLPEFHQIGNQILESLGSPVRFK